MSTADEPIWGGPARAADVLLRTLGGCAVGLVIPVAQAAAALTCGMGMQTALVEELTLFPTLVRTSRAGVGTEVVTGAETLRAALGVGSEGSVVDAIGREARVRIGDRVARIASVELELLGGIEYLYRIRLED